MIIGIDATNIGYGGGGILFINFMNEHDFKKCSIDKVIIWAGKALKTEEIVKREEIKIIKKDFRFRIQRIIWQIFFLKTDAELELCERLYFPGGYYLGRFRPFNVVFQNALPFSKEALRLYRYSYLYFCYILLRYMYLYSFNRADKIMFLKPEANDFIEPYLQLKKNKTEFIKPVLSPQFRNRNITPSDKNIILNVGSLKYYKNQVSLCRVVKTLRNKGSDVKLIIVGDKEGYHAKKILKQIREIDPGEEFIITPGYVKHCEIIKYYEMADKYVESSLCEACGIGFMEANEFGIKSIKLNTFKLILNH